MPLAQPLQPIALAVRPIISITLAAIPVPAHLVFIKTLSETVMLAIQVALLALAMRITAPLAAALLWGLATVRVLAVLLLASIS